MADDDLDDFISQINSNQPAEKPKEPTLKEK